MTICMRYLQRLLAHNSNIWSGPSAEDMSHCRFSDHVGANESYSVIGNSWRESVDRVGSLSAFNGTRDQSLAACRLIIVVEAWRLLSDF